MITFDHCARENDVETPGIKRRLTCILAADAVGYSQQTSHDEEGTLRVLAAHRAVIDGIVAFHEGRIVSTAGDSVLAEFASPVEAVRSAVEIQDALKTRNDALPEERRLLFRVGVNLGDVVVKNDDLLGDGVNVAARLEGIAEPGGICISSSVYDQITGKLDLGFQDIGEQSLKNISRPVRAYRLSGARATGSAHSPRRAARGRGWWAVPALLALGALGTAAWFAGWIGAGRPAPPNAPAVIATDDAAAKEAALRRAKQDDEAVKARDDAEAMKRAAEAELARARADADASRTARARVEADATAARARFEAEATTARARAEADAMKRDAAAEVAKADQARKDADAARAAAVVSTPAVAPAQGTGAYDGKWTITRTCERYQELDSFTDQLVTTIHDGDVAIERGTRGQPGFLTLQGRVAGDGELALTGYAIARSKRNYGRETPASLSGTLAGASPALTGGWGGRRCTFAFARAG
jgi:class 3 adenylate cyclase